MIKSELQEIIDNWQLPEGGPLLERIRKMIRPALMAGRFGSSPVIIVGGMQYHLGGEKDTKELADLASITSSDHVLDVCCFIGGPAIQLADSFQCKVTGIDISDDYIAVANQIAKSSGLSHLVEFRVADAGQLPFEDGEFTVVWSQCSLMHYGTWLREFDRVVAQGGRLAITFEIGNNDPDKHDSRWRLHDVVRFLENLGYSVEHADDITKRDVEIGWKALDHKLSQGEKEFIAVLGEEWVRNAHKEFADDMEEMCLGIVGNGRIVAIIEEETRRQRITPGGTDDLTSQLGGKSQRD